MGLVAEMNELFSSNKLRPIFRNKIKKSICKLVDQKKFRRVN